MTTRLDSSGASGRPEEAAVRLQHAGQHDADAVERHLRREHHAASARPRRRSPAPAHWSPPQAQRADQRTASDGQQQRRPARAGRTAQVEQRRRGPVDGPPVAAGQRPGEHRHHGAGQRAAGDDLEEHVRQRVGASGTPMPDAGSCRRCRRTPASGRSRPRGRAAVTARDQRRPRRPARARRRRRRGSLTGLRRGPAAQRVELAQAGRALDHRGEADPLAGQGQRRPRRPARPAGRPAAAGPPAPYAEQRAGRVRAGVAEHRPLAQVRGQQRRGRHRRRPRPAPPPGTGQRARPARAQRPPSAPGPGRRSSRLTRLARAGDQRAADQDVDVGQRAGRRRRAVARRGGEARARRRRSAAGARPTTLTAPVVTSPRASAPRWPRQALAGPPLGQVVVRAEARPPPARRRGRGAHPRSAPRRPAAPRPRARGERRALEQLTARRGGCAGPSAPRRPGGRCRSSGRARPRRGRAARARPAGRRTPARPASRHAVGDGGHASRSRRRPTP